MRDFPEYAFVLAAGLGERLAPITNFMPKALVPVAGIPALRLVVERIKSFGVQKVFVNACHKSAMIVDFVREGGDIEVIVEPIILGTAGGLANMAAKVKPKATVLVHNADVIEDFDLSALYDVHRQRGRAATLILVDDDTARKVKVDDELVAGFDCDGYGDCLTYSGVAFFEPEVLESFQGKRNLVDALAPWVNKGEVAAAIATGYFRDIGTHKSFHETHRDILIRGMAHHPSSGKKVFIADTAHVEDGVLFEGFVAINGSAFVPSGAKLKDSIVLPFARLVPAEYENCIVCPDGEVIPVQ